MTYRQIFTQGSNANSQDSYNLADSKSYAFEDFPHFVNILATYDLPIGKGKKFFNSVERARWMRSSAAGPSPAPGSTAAAP